MKAAVISRFGSPEVFSIVDTKEPEVGPEDVLIRVLAIGLNRLDHYAREGSINPGLRFPHILGSDISGIIEKIGNNVKGFKIGDRVIPMPGYPIDDVEIIKERLSATPSYEIRGIYHSGVYAEYVVFPAKWVVKDTTGLSPEQVATLPMKLVTGVQALRVVGEIKQGDKVLIQAGNSGTGSISIQIAKALGASVATTLNGSDRSEAVSKLGADFIIDSSKQDFVEAIKNWTNGEGVDVIVDNLGGTVFTKSIEALKPMGILVSMGMVLGSLATIDLVPFFFAQKQIKGTVMGGLEDMKWGLEQVKKGYIKPVLGDVFDLKDITMKN